MASAVSPVELITAVQAHPELWDVAHPLHGDRIRKVKAWEDIIAAITPGWEDLRHGERKEISKILQRRWKSLSDRVRRDLMDEDKAARSGVPAPAKKPHVYYTNLLFLRQNMMNNTRPTTSNITQREVAAEEAEVERPSSPLVSTGSPRAMSEGGVQCTDEESRALESVSTASQQGGEQRGRGGVRGRGHGHQTRGRFNMEADDRVLVLLQESAAGEAQYGCIFGHQQPTRLLLPQPIPHPGGHWGDQEKHCMDRIYGIAMQYRQAKLSGGPPSCDPYNASHDPPMAPGTSAVLAPPSQYLLLPQRRPPPIPSQTSFYTPHSYGEFPPSTFHLPFSALIPCTPLPAGFF
ncbi:hypothetical protein AB205_0126790 [Aquarana catesbeiana]|uniref:MADF domain-containing protein n=1 Tax=Aquarana catesbeiana TaxID=8400 RepID=A0A2G9QDJ6_AQUCT|nr:hypothetical protein AB205_0126790 [Aquarana catesbeiana]